MKGWVFSGKLFEEPFKGLCKVFFQGEKVYFIQEDSLSPCYEPGEGFPKELQPRGRLFSPKGEIMWQREGDKYVILLLTEMPGMKFEDFELVPGEWEVEDGHEFHLIPPDTPYISPPFSAYPEGAKRLKACVYLKEGMACLIRLKEFGNDKRG